MKEKGDFTADYRLIWISSLAVLVGALCAVVALVLQRLIAFFTALFYYRTLTIPNQLVDPPVSFSGWEILAMVAVPVLGA
jgi:hypothetical protein